MEMTVVDELLLWKKGYLDLKKFMKNKKIYI